MVLNLSLKMTDHQVEIFQNLSAVIFYDVCYVKVQ